MEHTHKSPNTMNWNDALNQLPQHDETVMIAIDRLNCLATYDANENAFKLVESKKMVWIEQGGANIQWQRLQVAQNQ